LVPSTDVVVRPCKKCGASMPEMDIRRRVLRRACPEDGGEGRGAAGFEWLILVSWRGALEAKVLCWLWDGIRDRCRERHDAQTKVARELGDVDDRLLRVRMEAFRGRTCMMPLCDIRFRST
jgi:hypothetical protein